MRLSRVVAAAFASSVLRRAISACNACVEPEQSSLTTARLVISRARWTKRRVEKVSEKWQASGETFAMMQVFALPPSESLSRYVSFESR